MMPGDGAGGGRTAVSRRSGAAEWGPVATLGLILLVTVAWWALALWPSGGAGPAWLERARAVCFNLTGSGLPDASGWMLLVGQPLGMVALLGVGWGSGLERGLRRMAHSTAGRATGSLVALLVAVGLAAAGVRVSTARAAVAPPTLPPPATAESHPRLDHAAPAALLVDQHGRRVGVPTFDGRPVLVTFAFGNCATICPVVVQQATLAMERLAADGGDVGLLVVSLDPWRDTPARLPALAEKWGLPDGAHVVSGDVEEVEAALDAWKVARERDARTGDVIHPALTYVVGPDGTVRYATTGRADDLVGLLEAEAG